ncbi:FlgO family outer membrane protein [Alteromonas oceanisediminis]|uniref:FlgO family outer membrane protein n=1 Tax=Alteromonas oceanisediminis TaxID=2836180 RepID=UPI001BDA81CD|nr:FlgO family outer membrane protein [Alteromonas oceanisediminis]MBT0587283.1 hypothetical protein [Alteromonas oceanisediminis]
MRNLAMNSVLVSIILSALLGCSTVMPEQNFWFSATETPEMTQPIAHSQEQSGLRDYASFSASRHNKSLGDYVQQMVMELDTQKAIDGTIAVASFVDFNETLADTHRLGNQIAEAVLIEMTQFGYPVTDVSTMQAVESSVNGFFAFNRKPKNKAKDYCCVISGNLVYEPNGVRVNTKLVEFEGSKVLGASSVTIPYFVVEHLAN